MTKPASFYCSLYIDFNNKINTEDFSKQVNIKTKRGIKKIDDTWGCDNEWYKDYYSLTEALSDFFASFSNRINELNNQLKVLNSEKPLIIVDIIVYDNNIPELCLDGNNMEIIHKLNANVHFNISNES